MSKGPVVAVEVATWLKGLAADGDEPMLVSERRNSCFHRRHPALVDTGARTLRCQGCGAPLDPYEYIGWLATGGDHLARTKRQLAELSASIRELVKREQNAKARVKRMALTVTEPEPTKSNIRELLCCIDQRIGMCLGIVEVAEACR